ncbi:MAG TPA: hypothetical protein VEX15_05280 [Nocardioidaceae bacterium]|nr:hypothetical protein [Nocardioidaceae bacterium]
MRPPTWRRCLVAAAVAAPLLIAPAAAAPGGSHTVVTKTVTDGDDTGGPLDIVRVRHRVVSDGSHTQLAYAVRVQGPFDDADLSWRHRHFIVDLDTDGEPGAEFNVTIFGRDRSLRADLISNATREVVAHLAVGRIDERTVRVLGPRRLLGAHKVFWTSNFHRRGIPACGWDDGYPITCQDTAPDRGWIRLDPIAWPDSASDEV